MSHSCFHHSGRLVVLVGLIMVKINDIIKIEINEIDLLKVLNSDKQMVAELKFGVHSVINKGSDFFRQERLL